MAELYTGVPLFRGDSEIGMIFKITQVLGKPNEDMWPGVTSLPNYREKHPNFQPADLTQLMPDLEPEGIELLKLLLEIDPSQRITAKSALNHPYFDELRQNQTI